MPPLETDHAGLIAYYFHEVLSYSHRLGVQVDNLEADDALSVFLKPDILCYC
jgi:hypothetical protein